MQVIASPSRVGDDSVGRDEGEEAGETCCDGEMAPGYEHFRNEVSTARRRSLGLRFLSLSLSTTTVLAWRREEWESLAVAGRSRC